MKKLFLIIALIVFGIPVFAQNTEPITDELLYPRMYADSNNQVFKLGIYERGEYQYIPIEDELIDGDFVANASNFAMPQKEYFDEYFLEKQIDLSKVRHIKPKTKYDFTKKRVPVHIQLAKHIKSTKELLEGADIPFIATQPFEINGKTYEKGTPVLGRVEIISASDKMGVPETLKIANFYIRDNGEEINLHGSVSKTGANRSIWVYPLYQAGNITFYVAGFVFVPIHGGRAKLSTTESFTVFYETH